MNVELLRLFENSNFERFQYERNAPILEAGLSQHGVALGEVQFIHQDLGVWVFSRTGLFRAGTRGMFKKVLDVGPFLRAADFGPIQVEPSGPHTSRLVIGDRTGGRIAKIDFSAGGPGLDAQTERNRCSHIGQTMQRIWSQAPSAAASSAASAAPPCPCGAAALTLSHLESHIIEVTTTNGIDALAYDCPSCGVGTELWRNDDEGRGGAPAGLSVHLWQAHGLKS